ncbi:MAG: antitermination protein NusB [Eggerthellaceae bacterium]|nr:antitermination protein NusB [Eggerthellaceae bacterium]
MSRLNGGRRVAAQVGAAVRERRAFTADILETYLRKAKLSREDAAFARVLALGVTSTVGTLDETIDRCLNSPDDIKDDVRDCLRVSTYEMLFLDKAGHAAVDQGVELVRSVQPKASRLANAVLRKVLKAAGEFPYGDPAVDDDALARSFGFPLWLAEKLVEWMGREEAARFMAACNQPAPVFFAVNACKADDAEVKRVFAREHVQLQDVRISTQGDIIPGCLHAPSASAVGTHAARTMFADGSLLVSDAAAQAIALLALPQEKPGRFLEVGSGRGTKTILLQSDAMRRYGSQIDLTALDAHGFKANLLRKRAQLYGIQLADVVSADARKLSDSLGRFDTAFVDAPCSGLGTLRRHPEIRWRLAAKDIIAMAQVSFDMLRGVAGHVAPQGRLVFATCTVAPEENELLLKRFLESPEGSTFRIEPCSVNSLSKLFFKTRLTEGGCDAHFAAILRRVG